MMRKSTSLMRWREPGKPPRRTRINVNIRFHAGEEAADVSRVAKHFGGLYSAEELAEIEKRAAAPFWARLFVRAVCRFPTCALFRAQRCLLSCFLQGPLRAGNQLAYNSCRRAFPFSFWTDFSR